MHFLLAILIFENNINITVLLRLYTMVSLTTINFMSFELFYGDSQDLFYHFLSNVIMHSLHDPTHQILTSTHSLSQALTIRLYPKDYTVCYRQRSQIETYKNKHFCEIKRKTELGEVCHSSIFP